MQWLLRIFSAAVVCAISAGNSLAGPVRQVDVHDPAMARDGGTYYLYSTGPGIPFYSSKDMVHWATRGRVFATEPAWARSVNAHFNGHVWAPDISFHEGRYYLYYAVSSPGVNDSAIGLTINKTLNPASADYMWEDQGIVLRSVAGRDLWNAIDPNVIVDEKDTPWLALGSFWSGIKLVRLNASWTAPAEPEEWHAIAKRERSVLLDDRAPGPAEIEGAFIFKKGDYYYLFVSWGKCCIGKNSTYRIMIGRSKDVTGPYLDRDGNSMASGGGSLLFAGNERWAGWGGNSVYSFGNRDYVVFHAYEAADNDFHRLKIAEIKWDAAGWPVVDPTVLDRYRGILVK